MSEEESGINLDFDDLNGPFKRATTIPEVTKLYLEKADFFHVDQSSGGDRERAEQFIKFLVALVTP